jgi:outer membrane murein-binding lipoprotein Lpp
MSVVGHPIWCVYAVVVLQSFAAENTLADGLGDMSRELKILIVAGLIFLSFFAYGSIKKEYARIQTRVETTQAKVDALADELQATTKTIHAAIRSLTDRFLAGEGQEIGVSNEASPAIAVDTKPHPTLPTIVMHSGYDCGPCNAWLSSEMPKWIQSGWRVEVLKELDTVRSWPWYEITDRDGARFEVTGPLNNNNFQAAKAGAK